MLSGAFNGDSVSGTFEILTLIGYISGTYFIEDLLVRIMIDHKPAPIGCVAIEEYINDYVR